MKKFILNVSMLIPGEIILVCTPKDILDAIEFELVSDSISEATK